MQELFEKITASELKVLDALWDAGRALTVAELRRTLTASTPWEASTIKTLLYRLCEKGVVTAKKQDVFRYSPAISREVYSEYATQNVINRLYGGSAKNLVASLIGGNTLSDGDIEELRALFQVGDDHA